MSESHQLPAIRHEHQPVGVRPATQDDFAFIDGLQKANSKALGFQYEQAIRKLIERGNVLLAEERNTREPLGYVLGVDKYLKRDELGIVYQLAVAPGNRRRLIGAHLLKAQFENSAYGCRLYCCWCAQDLAANHFWEAMGFVPLAFRTGGGRTKKSGPRIHIFWQKRIRTDDRGGEDTFPY
ncbi:MAG: GNAT family N-acetyltransferase, partial [Planctomycetota bacterium]